MGIKNRDLQEMDEEDLKSYFDKLFNIGLHMKLSDPEISLAL